MPIYGYRCGQCGHELEVFQSMSDAPLKTCPECGGSLRKLLYPVGVRFKGSGFYTTDYKNGGRSTSEAKAGEGSSEGEGKSEGKPAEGKSESASGESKSKKADAPAAKD